MKLDQVLIYVPTIREVANFIENHLVTEEYKEAVVGAIRLTQVSVGFLNNSLLR